MEEISRDLYIQIVAGR